MKNYIKNFYDMLKQDCTHHSGKACSEISTSWTHIQGWGSFF